MASALLASHHSRCWGLESSCRSSTSVSPSPTVNWGFGSVKRRGVSFARVVRRSGSSSRRLWGSENKNNAAAAAFDSKQPLRLGTKRTTHRLKDFGLNGGALQAYSRNPGYPEEAKDKEGPESRRITIPVLGELPFNLPDVGEITPKKVAIFAVLGALVYATLNIVASRTVFNPQFWTYASWILVMWPLPAAIGLGLATLVTAYRVAKRKPKEWEQVLMLVGSLVWLILVPLGYAQGFVDGWPLLLFSLYTAFFLISAVVRYRLYGDLAAKGDDKQWATSTSRGWQIGFVASVVGGHWLAAWEAPFLALSWNFGWKTKIAAAVLALAVVTHYNATYFLGKYFDRLVKPRAVVMFGPYRWVRHPIYASYILLFLGYCLALRSYKSALFLLTACIVYYEHRTNLEEEQLIETFGELYRSYVERVQNKYFPLLY